MKCIEPYCPNIKYTRQWCAGHYKQIRIHGTTDYIENRYSYFCSRCEAKAQIVLSKFGSYPTQDSRKEFLLSVPRLNTFEGPLCEGCYDEWAEEVV